MRYFIQISTTDIKIIILPIHQFTRMKWMANEILVMIDERGKKKRCEHLDGPITLYNKIPKWGRRISLLYMM